MSSRAFALTEAMHHYVIRSSVPADPLLERLRAETAQLEWGMMQISPDQGQLMALLVKLMGARRCIEVGTFTGYSALVVARALPADGQVICCDISEEYTRIARRYWAEAGVADKIDLRLAPALETLNQLRADGQDGTFDFAFIDADKVGYPAYVEACLALLRPGGVISLDNVFMGGRVLEEHTELEGVQVMQQLNARLAQDPRVTLAMIPIGDGLTLAMKNHH